MTAGMKRQAHAPGRVGVAPSADQRESRVEAMLTDQVANSPQTERLDFTPEFSALNDAARSVLCFAGAAVLIGEDTFEGRLDAGDAPGHYKLEISMDKIERLRWALDHFEDLARQVRDATEALENLASWERIDVPVTRRSREARS